MEGGGDGQENGLHGPLLLGDGDGALHGGAATGDHHLSVRIVIGRFAHFALRGFGGDGGRGGEVEAEQRRHGAFAHRHGLLHGGAANAQEARGVGNGEGASGGERRIFAQRMTGHEGGVGGEAEASFRLQHAQGGERDGHEGRLGIGGEGQFIRRAVPHEGGKLLREGRVHLVEDGAGGGEGVGKGLAHTHLLAALSGKDEGRAHGFSRVFVRA